MRNTKLTILTSLLFFGIMFTSCEKDANFVVPEGNSKLFAFSEITSEDKIKVYVSTSIGVNTDDDFLHPKQGDVLITLFEDGVELENPGFRYIAAQKAFLSQGSFRPEVGKEYGLEVKFLKESDIKPIYASTFIPIQENPVINDIRRLGSSELSGTSDKQNDIQAKFSFNDFKNEFYMLRMKGLTEHGEVEMGVFEVVSGQGATYRSRNLEGILVSASKLQEDLIINLTNLNEIETSHDITHIEFELLSITKDAYHFYKFFSKQVDAQNASVSEPVISYSNFENGLGLFAGYSSAKVLVEVN